MCAAVDRCQKHNEVSTCFRLNNVCSLFHHISVTPGQKVGKSFSAVKARTFAEGDEAMGTAWDGAVPRFISRAGAIRRIALILVELESNFPIKLCTALGLSANLRPARRKCPPPSLFLSKTSLRPV